MPPAAADQPPAGDGVTPLGWLALGGLLLIGGLLLVLRRRRSAADAVPPEIAPDLPPAPATAPAPPPPAPRPTPAPAPPPAFNVDIGLAGVHLDIQAERLSLSLMNAALTFRLTLRHDGPTPLTGLVMRADLIGAHAALQQEEQLGGPAPDAPVVVQLPTLLAGEAQTVTREIRLPLAQVTAIRQGRSSLFVPLLRVALKGGAEDRRTLTALVGPPGQGGQVQPVRLDAGPRVVAPLLTRVLG